jgi:ABC-type transport system involved in cytochrome c biogenesis ATPase subunit
MELKLVFYLNGSGKSSLLKIIAGVDKIIKEM